MKVQRRTIARLAALWTLTSACGSSGDAKPDASHAPGTSDASHGPAMPDAGDANGSARVALPGLEMGNGFDDLRFSQTLGKVLAPGNYTGNVYLVEPDTLEVETISGLSSQPMWNGSDTQGPASLDEGDGLIFVGDRTAQSLVVLDPERGEVVAESALDGAPDYVRYVPGTHEVWVTEPYQMRVEVLSIPAAGTPTPKHEAFIALSQLPEGLGVDPTRGRVFSQSIFGSVVLVLDVETRTEIASWKTPCTAMHGNAAIDSKRGLLFVSCRPATAVVLDLDGDGAVLDSFDLDMGAGIPAYAAALGHLYFRGDPGVPIAVLDVADDGMLSSLATLDGANKGHCLAADDRGHVWACDEAGGSLLRFDDAY